MKNYGFYARRIVVAVKLGMCGVLALALCPGVGHTQQSQAAPADTERSGLEEIVVTAQKRKENLQDVPLKVTAFTPETLTANRIQTTQDLQFLAPSLVYTQLGGYAQPYLRGIGTTVSSPIADGTVATYIDGAVLSDSQSAIAGLLGIEQIEVLEGPQGTLFGRNSLAGAINITTLTPQQKFEAAGSVTQGNFGDTEGTARISGGVTDKLAVGLYVATTHSDSYYSRTFVVGEGHRDKDTGVRLKAVYDVTPNFKLTGSLEYTVTQSPDISAFRQGQANSYGFAAFGAPVVIAPWVLQNNYAFWNVNHGFSSTLREEYDLGAVQLVGISNYRRNAVTTSNDLDATSADILGSYDRQFNKQYSQELQVVSSKGSAWEYIGGLYFYHQDAGQAPTVSQSPFAFGPPTTNSFTDAAVITNSYAAFGQVTYSPVDNLRITLGGRYTDEKRTITDANFGLSSATGTINPMCCLTGPLTVYPDQSKSWSQFTPKAGIDYRIGDTLLYATFSEGFQSGLYNLVSPSAAPVNPEKLKAYEIGSKSDFLDKRLRANLSAYYYQFTDIQVQIDVSGSSNNGAETEFLNAAAAKAYGLEASLQAAVTNELQLSVQSSWQDSRYTRFPGFPAMVAAAVGYGTVPTDVAGNPLERAPKWVGSAAEDYHTGFLGGEIKQNLGYYYNGGFAWDPSNLHRQAPYGVLNGSLGYTFPGNQWTVTAWGKNITDKYYSVQYFPIVFGVLIADAMPRTYGATISYRY